MRKLAGLILLLVVSSGCTRHSSLLEPTERPTQSRITSPQQTSDLVNMQPAPSAILDPFADGKEVTGLIKLKDWTGLKKWAAKKILENVSDLVVGLFIKTQMEKEGYRCKDKPWWLYFLPDSWWYSLPFPVGGCVLVGSPAGDLP